MNELRDRVLEEKEKGNIIIATENGLEKVELARFIEQPVESMLYDLNRDEATVLTVLDEEKWINDYAVAQVIRALKAKIAVYEIKK